MKKEDITIRIDLIRLGESIGTPDPRKPGHLSFADFLSPLKESMQKVQQEPSDAGEFNQSMQACQQLMMDFISLQKDQFCAHYVLYANTHRLVIYPSFRWQEGNNVITGGRIALIPKDLPFKPKEEDLEDSKYPNHLIVWMCAPVSEVMYWEGIFCRKTEPGIPLDEIKQSKEENRIMRECSFNERKGVHESGNE